ncbi:unnamed protein product [Vitrella brassicaformis CCMP3155]|uniref:Uncharacterized protein n=1 Tax=Vitrella brassicaformis (strain CCMP3155) TaxID=1169540 RepID=A0A0G4EIZ6_VITBC|nr:unnamed protein product [Vitrella brassicaformis CCMP3155]|eukprot:CEL95879.1 unnamed protein product [Vitrella brassicaformis CCMP3155]
MQPTGAAPSYRPPSPALFQPADLLDIAVSKAAEMAMSSDPNRRAALRSQINDSDLDDEDVMLGHASRRVDEHISRLGLADVLDFDIGDDLEAGLKFVYMIERGSGEEWRAMGRFLRLAFIYRLTPLNAALPLRLSADALPTATAFYQLPLSMATYKTFGHLLTYRGTSLALQQADDNGDYRIGNSVTFRVVPFGELPGGHRYAESYKRTDPAIRWSGNLYPSFSAFLDHMLIRWWDREAGVGRRMVLSARIGRANRYRCLLRTEGITEDQGIAVDHRSGGGEGRRHVVVSGFRPGETVAAHLRVGDGRVELYTTEAPVADGSNPPAQRYPVSVGAARRLLRPFGLESDVIDRGTVVG